jgi:hypothetical protein
MAKQGCFWSLCLRCSPLIPKYKRIKNFCAEILIEEASKLSRLGELKVAFYIQLHLQLEYTFPGSTT